MASSALQPVTDALYDLLDTLNLGATVYRELPQSPSFPYVTIQNSTENRTGMFGRPGKSLLLQVHVFTSSETYAGAGQAHAIIAAINTATEYAALVVSGWELVFCRPEEAFDAGADIPTPGGIVYEHWVQQIRVEVLPD